MVGYSKKTIIRTVGKEIDVLYFDNKAGWSLKLQDANNVKLLQVQTYQAFIGEITKMTRLA